MTHAEKVLALLRDGKPHSHMEGYRLGVMLHSRVADLRKKGHQIRCWRDGDQYLYQLHQNREMGAEPNGQPRLEAGDPFSSADAGSVRPSSPVSSLREPAGGADPPPMSEATVGTVPADPAGSRSERSRRAGSEQRPLLLFDVEAA